MDSTGIGALGRAVRERREFLRYTQDDVPRHGGPSNTKVSELEQGKSSTVSNAVLRKLDKALQWEDGTAAAILAGGEAPADGNPFADVWDRITALEARVERLERQEQHRGNTAPNTQAGESPAGEPRMPRVGRGRATEAQPAPTGIRPRLAAAPDDL